MDVFEVDAVDLINVSQVVVGHNKKEVGLGWFLRKVCVRVANDEEPARYWMFPLDRYAGYLAYSINANNLPATGRS